MTGRVTCDRFVLTYDLEIIPKVSFVGRSTRKGRYHVMRRAHHSTDALT